MADARCYIALLLVGIGLTTAEIKNAGWWKNTVFYQIYPRSFMDSNADGIGDLKGITSKLDHFVNAGVGAIWLSPIYTSPMVDFGYDISNFTEIHHEYGTMADFEELTAQAKKKNLKVILDLVPNHSSDEHEWFAKSLKKEGKYKDYYMWKEGDPKQPPNNWISVFGGPAWTYNETRGAWYFHQFHYKQPDLNYSNPDVQKEMEDVMKFWLNKGVDGFRVDAVPHLFEIANLWDEPRSYDGVSTATEYTYLVHIFTKDQPETYKLVKSWRKVLDDFANTTNSAEKVMMTEAYTGLNETVEFYDAGAHVPFNFKFIIDVNSASPPSAFKNLIDSWTLEANKRNGVSNWVMGNHDRKRTETRYPNRGDQMTMLAMVLPGVAVTYYGEEIGMVDKSDIFFNETQDPQGCQAGPDKYKDKSRDPCRTPFQWDSSTSAGFSNSTSTWLPVHENYKTLNLKAEIANPRSHYNLYRNLTKLKSTNQALIKGSLKTVVTNEDKALAIIRTTNGSTADAAILIINFDDQQDLIVNITADVPRNFPRLASIAVTTLNSEYKIGDTVSVDKVNVTKASSVVIVTRTTTRSEPNGAESSLISIAQTILVLLVSLSMALR